MSEPECVFCQIFERKLPASWIHEDERLGVIMDTGPVNPGHVLVIPKLHAPHLADLPEDEGRHLFTVTQRTAQAIRDSGIRCEGLNLFLADGAAAGQEIFHVHMHVLPRFRGDPFRLVADWDAAPPRDELDAHAASIRAAYDG